MQWLTYTSGNSGNSNLFGESSFWIEKFQEMYLQHEPFRRLDKIVGNTSTHFQTWLEHPIPDVYYDAMVPTTDDYRKFDLPILTITGHYDGDQPGAFEYYKRHMQYGSQQSKQKHYLIIGPWDHAGTRTPQKEVGGLTFGDASLLDMNKLHTEWYDWTLKSGKKPEFLKDRIAYYVVGAEKWKYAGSLESISDRKLNLHLHSQDGIAGDVFHSGKLLSSPAANQQPDSFVYNPLDVRPAEIEKEEIKNSLTDQRYTLNLFGNGVVYHSEPFPENTEITGFPKLTLWMEMDVPDTDFQASIYEILPDGQSVLLTADLLRARYRESLRKETLVVPGEIHRYEFSAFPFFSRQITKGSRIRLVVSCLNSIHWQKNYNSGGVVADETAKDARTAHIKVYHDRAHPSSLELPVVRTDSR
jgi:putative CocE/NonD family hydrolase